MEQIDKVCTHIETIEDAHPSVDEQISQDTEYDGDQTSKVITLPENGHDNISTYEISLVEPVPTNTCDVEDSNAIDVVESCNNVSLPDTNNDVNVIVKNELNIITDDETTLNEQSCDDNNLSKDPPLINDESNDNIIKSEILNAETNITESTDYATNAGESTDEPKHCEEVLESLPQKSVVEECLLHESIKHINEDDDNQNNSIVTDAELTKLVEENSEVVVVTVETIPITTESSGENFVVTVQEKDLNVSCNESNLTLHKKDVEKSENENEDFNLIDYSQQSDGTVIEVISTAVVHSDVTESCVQNDNRESIMIEKIDSGSMIISNIPNDESGNNVVKSSTPEKGDSKNKQDNKKEIQHIIDCKTNADLINSPHGKQLSENEVACSKTVVSPDVDKMKSEIISSCKMTTVNTVEIPIKKRSVIQDIFDDWGDENPEEDNQLIPKIQDTVEIELKSLLDDAKITPKTLEKTVVIVEETICPEDIESSVNNVHHSTKEVVQANSVKVPSGHMENQIKNKHSRENIAVSVSKDQFCSTPHNIGRSSRNATQDSAVFNQVHQSQIIPVKSRNRHLTSQIASPAEVTEVLRERLREKQKIVEAPRGPDIFFVKKITQRLSSKLAGGPVSPIPALIPLPHPTQPSTDTCDRKTENSVTESAKEGNSDNKELLAILEGDVDPDWSNLKPPTLIEEGKSPANIDHTEHSSPPKLDPLVERELALKQLLELPVSSVKKSTSKKKKPLKTAPIIKVAKDSDKKVSSFNEEKKEIVNIDLIDEDTGSVVKNMIDIDLSPTSMKHDSYKEKSVSQKVQDARVDESRSGRKRKPTEKAREHEQNSIKRQKVFKSKVSIDKKHVELQDVTDINSVNESQPSSENVLSIDTKENETNHTLAKEVINKKIANKLDIITSKDEDSSLLRQPKQSLAKKGSQSIAKRKIAVKKLLRQKMSQNKKSTNLKTKLNTPPKKPDSKIVSKSQKRPAESVAGDPKPKKKIIDEIDRLLQDEGVVNLLYDVEQPDKKRLIPITKSQAKVMDIQKVQRELKIRKKLVRNAVLRLRTSSVGVSKVSPRSKRTAVYISDSHTDKKIGEQVKSPKTTSSSTEFIFPAKIRNAADASIIIRRHSSSSFSSASGSPRVSIDGPEKQSHDVTRLDEGGSHSLRSTKRRHSQDERISIKKSKKKAIQKSDAESASIVEDKSNTVIRSAKKTDPKKVDKNSKQTETVSNDENVDNSMSKVVTRSNGTATGKVTAKSKKAAKSKVTFAKLAEPDNNEEPSKEDELSACLAEAATALSIVNATGRSGNAAVTRKNKVNVNAVKVSDHDSNKAKVEQNQFCNKEINVRRHGNLVQLILTPSSSTKIRNALTLQVMQEFRDTLSILRKDEECRVVLLTSTGTSFCEGLELSLLVNANKDERRLFAQEMAAAVKDFIKSLATFNKPIVAGVQGAAVGLGVTMLPLFDLVIASDKATFSTPYGKLGQIAEGAAVFTLSHILGSTITSELLLGGRTLTASEALRAGLVTRVLWPDRFQVELLPSLRAMSEQSSQSMEATKTLLRHSLRKKLDAALESETYLLIQHWCSAECQAAIKAYIDGKVQ